MRQFLKLQNAFKNIALRKFFKVKEEKSKLTIKQMVERIKHEQEENEAKKRRKLKKKIEREYKLPPGIGDDKDLLYNKLINSFKRLLKILTSHSQAIDSMERNLDSLTRKDQPLGRGMMAITPRLADTNVEAAGLDLLR